MNAPAWHPRSGPVAGAACALLLLVTGCGFGEPDEDSQAGAPTFPTPSGPATRAPEITDVHEVIAAGLEIPWDLDFLPDGSALVTERDTGRILQVGPEQDLAGLVVEEVQRIEDLEAGGEGGLLGIAVSPEYESDRSVFIYYTTAEDNRIARLTLGEEPEPILTGIPHGQIHQGGRLEFGPDGYLYAGTGDADDPDRSQDPQDLAGGILRITTDGDPAPDNRFDSPTYAYGMRNVQGLAWDSLDRLWATDFGADAWDELNLVEAGGNHGWPEVEGIGNDDEFVDPQVVWEPPAASCSGVAAVGQTLVTACLRGQRLWVVRMTDSGTVLGAPEPLLVEEYGRLRAVVPAPDGSLWITTSNLDGRLRGEPDPGDDRIVRLVVAGGGGIDQV